MTVKDFVKMEKSGAMFYVVDADRNGYMTNPFILATVDRNTITPYGDWTLVGFKAKGKNNIFVYVHREVVE